jgi:hypothetical protein
MSAEPYAAFEAGDYATAAPALAARAREVGDAPEAAALFYDAALAYKFLRDWPNAYALGLEAAKRTPRGEQDPAFWNLGIAATIIGDWVTARDAWQGYGITLPDGHGEIVEDLGAACVRLDPAGSGEVVWVRRLCPARARVLNVPIATEGRRFGDIVLHDGEPKGRRRVGDREYPVFDELQVWRRSDVPTATVTVTAAEPEDIDALVDSFDDADFAAEPASSFVRLCKCCSEGTVEHARSMHGGTQVVWLGAPSALARTLLDAWAAEAPRVRGWHELELVDGG